VSAKTISKTVTTTSNKTTVPKDLLAESATLLLKLASHLAADASSQESAREQNGIAQILNLAKVKIGRLTFSLSASVSPNQKPITERQYAIIALIGNGLPDKAIAEKLGISQNTVVEHLKRLFRRFKVHSRSALLQQTALLS